mgnify:CR=1 FL=1
MLALARSSGGAKLLTNHAAWLQPAAAASVHIVSFLIKNYSPDCRFKSGFSIVSHRGLKSKYRVYTNYLMVSKLLHLMQLAGHYRVECGWSMVIDTPILNTIKSRLWKPYLSTLHFQFLDKEC